MLGLGAWELGMVLLVALVVLGPDKLPEAARKLARMLGQARRMLEDVRRNVDEVLHDHDIQPPAEPPKALFTAWVEEQQQKHGPLSLDDGTQGAAELPTGDVAGTEVATPAGPVQVPSREAVREVVTPAGPAQTPSAQRGREVVTPAGPVQVPSTAPAHEVVTPAGVAQSETNLGQGLRPVEPK